MAVSATHRVGASAESLNGATVYRTKEAPPSVLLCMAQYAECSALPSRGVRISWGPSSRADGGGGGHRARAVWCCKETWRSRSHLEKGKTGLESHFKHFRGW